ncbi:hypothetical protein N9165_01060 [Akkermansiaceae bacterium]|nr:hypothetical protein [Akkermansiaceae bacterium]
MKARELYDHSKSDVASENLVDHPDFTKVTSEWPLSSRLALMRRSQRGSRLCQEQHPA